MNNQTANIEFRKLIMKTMLQELKNKNQEILILENEIKIFKNLLGMD